MKKTLTLLSVVLVTLLSFTANAQDEKPTAKSYMSFFGGISTPLSDFKQSVYSNNKAGFAKKGSTYGLETGVYVHKNLAIAFSFAYNDQGELTTADAQTLSDGYNASLKKNQTIITAVNRYHFITLMLGPQYSFLYKSFTLDLRAQGGLIKSYSTPAITAEFDNGSSESLNQLSSKATAWGYQGSAGLRYSLGDSWDIGIKGNYLYTSGVKIENTDLIVNTGRLVTKQPITVFQTTLGITLKF